MTMSIKKYSRYWCVFGCLNSSYQTPSLSLFSIPKEEERRMKWLTLINREDLTTKLTHNIYVCEIHFSIEDVRIKRTRKCLKKNCLPCLHLPNSSKKEKQTQTDVTTVDKSSQTENIQNTTLNCFPCLHLPNSSKEDKGTQIDVIAEDKPSQTKNIQNTTSNYFPSPHLPNSSKEDKWTPVYVTTVNKPSQIENIQNTTVNDLMISNSSCQTNVMCTSELAAQTTASLSANTPRKRKLKLELLGCKKRLRVHEAKVATQVTAKSSKDMFFKLCDRFLSKDLSELVKNQTFLKSSHKGNRYSHKFKLFCLTLYYVSPKAYRLLQNTLCLPCRRTLNKLYIPMSTEVNDKLMAALKIKVNNMSEKEKQCSLVMDSMSLKTNLFYDVRNDKIIGFHEVDGVQSPLPAKHALVIIVRGIFVRWSQPIGFSLLSECSSDDNIQHWIDKIISKLFEIGLIIRVCVSDLGPDLLKASKKRGISVNKTYFNVANHKIYYIFDAPHLIKLIRNNFMTYDFYFQNGDIAKFEHIIKFYEYDKKKNFRQAYKLTSSHINPTSFEKMKVRYATQLLSRSVASGLSTYIDFKMIDESARPTVKFIKLMNDLFDTLNSSNLHHSYSHKNAFIGTEQQKDFLNGC